MKKPHKKINVMNSINWSYWLKQENLRNDEPYYILLGFNPEYWNLPKNQKNALYEADSSTYNVETLELLKSNVTRLKQYVHWNGNWKKFINECYERYLFQIRDFSTHDRNLYEEFVDFLRTKKLIPSHFDKYLNHDLYRPKYKKWFSDRNKITQEEAASLILGLEPKYYQQYREYGEIISSKEGGYYTTLEDNEKIFFYRSYQDFLNTNNLAFNINALHKQIEGLAHDDNLMKFVQYIHNQGFVLGNSITEYLKKEKKFPNYNKDSEIYTIYKNFSEQNWWTAEEAICLVLGLHPNRSNQNLSSIFSKSDDRNVIKTKAEILVFLDNNPSMNNSFHCYRYNEREKTQEVYIKNTSDSYPVELLLDKHLQRCSAGNHVGYAPTEILKCFENYTSLIFPAILKEVMSFKEQGSKADRGLNKASNSNQKTPTQRKNNYTNKTVVVSRFNQMLQKLKYLNLEFRECKKLWDYLLSIAEADSLESQARSEFMNEFQFIEFRVFKENNIKKIRWKSYNSKSDGGRMSFATLESKWDSI